MPPRRKSSGQKSEPKLFQCTGYGDCDMVFTRSEHLARHARKHTGEKPFKCVVPDCPRMFSRFDNMMQHTQTHNRTGKRKSLSDTAQSSAKKRRSSVAVVANRRSEFENEDEAWLKKHRSHSIHPDYHHNPYRQWRSPSPQESMIQSRTLPLPRRMSLTQPFYPPPPLSKSPSLPDSPEEPPLTSFRSASYNHSLQAGDQGRRRLSAADLKAPIHSLHQREEKVHPCDTPPAVVDITSDEYEALQGFGKFSSKVHTNEEDQVVLPAIQSNTSTQVAAFRQKLMPTQESYQRPLRGNAI